MRADGAGVETNQLAPELPDGAVRMVFGHATSTPRNGRRCDRSTRDRAARSKHFDSGSARPNVTTASALA
jgi:hypothetical protein